MSTYSKQLAPDDDLSVKKLWLQVYPWLVWALSSSFLFYKYILQVSPSVMVTDLMQTFNLSGQSLGNLAAYYFYAYLAMQLPVGLLLDYFSPRRLVVAAVAVCALGALLFANAHHLTEAALGRLLIGLGGAFSAVGTMKLITVWFPPRRFALVSGLMMTVGMLGAVGGEAPLAHFVQQFGWRETMLVAASMGFVLALLIGVCVRDRVEVDQARQKKGFALKQFFSGVMSIIHNPQAWLISLYSGLAFAPISAFAGLWGVPYLMEKYQLTRTHSAGLISLAFIGFAIGSPLAGWLSDRLSRRKPIMVAGTFLGMLLLLVVLYCPLFSNGLLGAAIFCFGFFTSFFFVSFALMREINFIVYAGVAIGFINMFNAICGALSEPLIGKLLDLGWGGQIKAGVRLFSISNYHVALVVLPIAMALALLLLFFIKETYCQQQDCEQQTDSTPAS